MAIYRSVQCIFWSDPWVQTLTPEEKLFYLNLLTNEYTTQTGIYQITKRQLAFDTGFNDETAFRLLNRFIEQGKILYDEKTQEIFILNWSKHNWSDSPKVVECILKELRRVKNKEFVKLYWDKVSELYGYSMDTIWEDLLKKKNKKKKNNNKKKNYGSFYENDIESILLNETSDQEKEEGEEFVNNETSLELPVPELDKTLIIPSVYKVWLDEYPLHRSGNDYDITDFQAQYDGLEALLNLYYSKKDNEGKKKDQLLSDFRHIFQGALSITNEYYSAKMSVPFLAKNYNEIKNLILNKGSSQNGKSGNSSKSGNGTEKQAGILNAVMDQLGI